MAKQEIWRPVVGYEGFYEVSSKGRVRSLDRLIKVPGTDKFRAPKQDYWRRKQGTILMPALRTDGYYKVNLYNDRGHRQFGIHRLVCTAFHGVPKGRKDAAHNDGNKLNNHADNLRWATREENMADKLIHDTHRRGSRANLAKLNEEQVRYIRRAVEAGETQRSLAEQFGVHYCTINLIVKRKNWFWLD